MPITYLSAAEARAPPDSSVRMSLSTPVLHVTEVIFQACVSGTLGDLISCSNSVEELEVQSSRSSSAAHFEVIKFVKAPATMLGSLLHIEVLSRIHQMRKSPSRFR